MMMREWHCSWVLSKCFALLSVDCAISPALQCSMANHFCALVLFDCAFGMDHESTANQ